MDEAWSGLLYWHIPMALWWIVGPFLAWRIGLRLYRLLARQAFSVRRSWRRAACLGSLTLAVGAVAFRESSAFYALCGGLVLGAVLGAIGSRLTLVRFERGGAFFDPDRLTGAVLAVLLVAHVGWRFFSGSAGNLTGITLAEFVRHPSTMILFGLFSAHYLVYSIGLVRVVQAEAVANGGGASEG